MSVVVGYSPQKGDHGSLDLGRQLAHALGRPMVVVTVVPRQWTTPSLARVDAEFAEFTRQVGRRAEAGARAHLERTGEAVPTRYRAVAGRSSSTTLLDVVAEVGGSVLVLGSATDGASGRITVGATTGKLLHSSPVLLALSPRGYRSEAGAGISRVTCAFSDNDASERVVAQVAEVTAQVGAPLLVTSFGVRGAPMYPSEVGYAADEAVLAGWHDQVLRAQRDLVEHGVIGPDAERVVGTGSGWGEAMASIAWKPDELLALGSSTTGALARVFLGARAAKLIRHSPVPVVVVPTADPAR